MSGWYYVDIEQTHILILVDGVGAVMIFDALALAAVSFRTFLKTETQRRVGVLHLIAHLPSLKTGQHWLPQIPPSLIDPRL